MTIPIKHTWPTALKDSRYDQKQANAGCLFIVHPDKSVTFYAQSNAYTNAYYFVQNKATTTPTLNRDTWLRVMNEKKILEFRKLSVGWDGYNAHPIPLTVINRVLSVIKNLKEQPLYIFPSARETIQIEYDIDDKSLEIEIGSDNIEFLSVDGSLVKEWSSSDIKDVFRVINEFHTKRLVS
ncbi:MAG: hypothetical protein WCK32_03105 [Chlorobiaceae bacterium]